MKKAFVLIITLLYFLPSFANHISGGELFYEYLGQGSDANSARYKITMRLFRDCHSTGQTLDAESVFIGIYNTATLVRSAYTQLELQRPIQTIDLNTGSIPCLTKAPEVCYQVGIFTGIVELSATSDGYTLSWIRCCRPDNLANLSVTTSVGGNYITQIPGTTAVGSGNNSSPQFAVKDTSLVCQNRSFVLDFGASDPDGDSLSYSFCDAYTGGSAVTPNPGSDPSGPPTTLDLTPLPYYSPFSGTTPLGTSVIINPTTGKITGIAPVQGRYVINVCVTEWRDGKPINLHRKDFILAVGECDFASAEPLPVASAWCKDFKVNFSNNNTSAAITAYSWDFGVDNSTTDVSTDPEPVFTYPDTGSYTITLTVTGLAGCVDTASTTIGVYPGFKPAFDVIGSCYKTDFVFKDRTSANYGQVNSWKWDFGDTATTSDASTAENPSYKYPDPGVRNAKLVVTSTKGCTDSVEVPVTVKDAALLALPFKDTLICNIDTLPLIVEGTGTFNWTPAYNIINANSSSPLVYPKDTTTCMVTFTDANGCSNSDSVTVNVLNSISVNAGADTAICSTDNLILNTASQGLQFNWSPATGLSDPSIKNPVASPLATTTYFVTANLGKCEARDTISVKVAPYPAANAGTDVSICYGTPTQLNGIITGTFFSWSPAGSLQNANSLAPVAVPRTTTKYVLTVFDTLGCPKPSSDTVLVSVKDPVIAFAGNDTSIVANQPLQLNATGGSIYEWSPSTGMNDPSLANPIVTLGASVDSVTYKLRVSIPEGCFSEDEVKVRVFKTGPDIFIPTAFTPNADGKNDILKPVVVGLRNIDYFRVFNRWGQLVYATSSIGQGWNGTINGVAQASGTYVFMAGGTDYLGKPILRKGTVVLIR